MLMTDWGFDLTSVKSDKSFYRLMRKHKFKQVDSEPIEYWMKGRFTKGVTTFANPKGIRITVEHLGGKKHDKGALGYIGIKAPKKSEKSLKKFLSDFRGKRVIREPDKMNAGGIVTHVKGESPYRNPFIRVRDMNKLKEVVE